LGEQGGASLIRGAATLSVPYDLAAASRHLDRLVGRIYFLHFRPRLVSKTLDLLARFPAETAAIDGGRVRRLRTFGAFDDCVTAPLHGFAGAADYHARASAIGFLARIEVPTLCFSAEDDPFFPGEAVARARAVAAPA